MTQTVIAAPDNALHDRDAVMHIGNVLTHLRTAAAESSAADRDLAAAYADAQLIVSACETAGMRIDRDAVSLPR